MKLYTIYYNDGNDQHEVVASASKPSLEQALAYIKGHIEGNDEADYISILGVYDTVIYDIDTREEVNL